MQIRYYDRGKQKMVRLDLPEGVDHVDVEIERDDRMISVGVDADMATIFHAEHESALGYQRLGALLIDDLIAEHEAAVLIGEE